MQQVLHEMIGGFGSVDNRNTAGFFSFKNTLPDAILETERTYQSAWIYTCAFTYICLDWINASCTVSTLSLRISQSPQELQINPQHYVQELSIVSNFYYSLAIKGLIKTKCITPKLWFCVLHISEHMLVMFKDVCIYVAVLQLMCRSTMGSVMFSKPLITEDVE